jgi:hypothetical protein
MFSPTPRRTMISERASHGSATLRAEPKPTPVKSLRPFIQNPLAFDPPPLLYAADVTPELSADPPAVRQDPSRRLFDTPRPSSRDSNRSDATSPKALSRTTPRSSRVPPPPLTPPSWPRPAPMHSTTKSQRQRRCCRVCKWRREVLKLTSQVMDKTNFRLREEVRKMAGQLVELAEYAARLEESNAALKEQLDSEVWGGGLST